MTRPRKSGVGVGIDSRARCDARYKFDKKETSNNEVDDEINDEVGKKGQKMSKSKNLFKKLSKSKEMVRSDFLTPVVRLAFTKLRQAFVKAPIFYHFDSERHFWVKIDISGYIIVGVLS